MSWGVGHLDLTCGACGWIGCATAKSANDPSDQLNITQPYSTCSDLFRWIPVDSAENLSVCLAFPRSCNAFCWPFESKLANAHCSKLWDMLRMCPLPISTAGPLLPFEALSGNFLSVERLSAALQPFAVSIHRIGQLMKWMGMSNTNKFAYFFWRWQPSLLGALVRPSAWLHSAQVPRCSNHRPETVRGSANYLGARLARYRQAEGVLGGGC